MSYMITRFRIKEDEKLSRGSRMTEPIRRKERRGRMKYGKRL
jgi:hypothetical protein